MAWSSPPATATGSRSSRAASGSSSRARKSSPPRPPPCRGCDGDRAPARRTATPARVGDDAGAPIAATLVYDTTLFTPATIARLAGHLQELTAGFDLERVIGELPLLTADERVWLDAVATGAARESWPKLLHRRIERHARAT